MHRNMSHISTATFLAIIISLFTLSVANPVDVSGIQNDSVTLTPTQPLPFTSSSPSSSVIPASILDSNGHSQNASIPANNISSQRSLPDECYRKAPFHSLRERRGAEALRIHPDLVSMFNDFRLRQENSVQRLNVSSDPCGEGQRFLVTTMGFGVGWGNRLPSLVTGFLLAAIMNRTFFIEADRAGHHMNDFLEPPFTWDYTIFASKLRHTEQPLGVHGKFQHDFLFSDMRTFKQDACTLRYLDIDYAVPMLQANPHIATFFTSLFPHGTVFHPVSAFLFRPNLHFRAAVADFATQHFHTHTVGLQVRMGKFRGLRPERFVSLGRGLAYELRMHAPEYLPTGSNLTSSDLEELSECPPFFFIAADAEEPYSVLGAKFGPEGYTRTENKVGAARTIGVNPGTESSGFFDLLLLCECDDLVITYGSSYGTTASGLTNHHATVVYPDPIPNLQGEGMPWYWRQINSEPCMYITKSQFHESNEPDIREAFWNVAGLPQQMQCHP